jgi:small subunit ribosomal protein S4
MARYTESVCRLCRREGAKLFLKGTRCYTKKCSFERRPTPPGQHGVRRRKMGDFGIQLREKQKVRRVYGVLERQFRNYYREAESQTGVTGEALLQSLETRLDNVVFRATFGSSRNQARQLVRHGHVSVNGRRVTIPSYQVRKGDVVELRTKAQNMIVVQHNLDTLDRTVPPWLEVDGGSRTKVTVHDLPMREHIDVPVREQLIVELYSK